ncbi:MAG: Ig-like domain-containing protein [Spirochaetota bacterium]
MKKNNKYLVLVSFLLIVLSACNKVEDGLKPFFPRIESSDAPKVIASIPAQNATGVAENQEIIITFNKNINQQSCINAFSIQPTITGLYTFLGPVMSFKASENFRGGVTYVATLSTRCEDENGRDLNEPYAINFTTSTDVTNPEVLTVQAKKNSTGCTDSDAYQEIVNFTTSTYNSTDICTNSPVVITFSKTMDIGTTEANLTSAPGVIGSYQWSSENRVVTFTPASELSNGITYIFTIAAATSDSGGNTLGENKTFSFTVGTDGTPPTITALTTDLSTGSGGCDAASNDSIFTSFLSDVCVDNASSGSGAVIQVTFSEAMEQTVTPQAFSLTPSVEGNFSWVSDSVLQFAATAALVPNQQYQLTIAQTAQDLAGNTLQDSYTSYFQTSNTDAYPTISTISLATGTVANCAAAAGTATDLLTNTVTDACNGNATSNPITVTFSESMNQANTESAITLSPSISGVFSWPANNQLLFTPDEQLTYGQRYTLSVSTAAEDSQGQLMQDQVSTSFVVGALDTTEPNLTCANCGVDFEINNDGDNCGATPDDVVNQQAGSSTTTEACVATPILIEFSEDMDQAETASAISFSPSGSFQLTWTADNILQVQPLTDLTSDTDYTLTISTAAKDLAGNALASDVVLTFKTENTSPYVYAIGLESSATCTGFATIGGCWWDISQTVQSPNNYTFMGQDSACGTDSTADNIIIIFSKAMDITATVNAVTLTRISPPITNIIVSSWKWTDTNRALALSFSEDKATNCSNNAAGSFDTWDDASDTNANYPYYMVEVDTTAQDTTGNTLSSTFTFFIEKE